mgnify:CR=1 FL=1|jgi:hypothetical protein|tara:strand:- start:1228 stop:1536 length:309 start_codon:yes stop_codon:yes gene_type:complete
MVDQETQDDPFPDDPPEEPENGSIEVGTQGPKKAALSTIDWISKSIISSWLVIAVSASLGLLAIVFLDRPVPDMTVIKEVIQILGVPAGMILTYYFLEGKKK